MSNIPFIDERVIAVRTSNLRQWNARFLRKVDDKLFLIHHKNEPVAVLLSYQQYMRMMREMKESPSAESRPK